MAQGSPLWRVLYEGRHCRVFLLGASQFPLNVSASLRDAAYWLYFFRISDPYQLSYVLQRCGTRVADIVRSHTGYRPLHWTPRTAAVECVDVLEKVRS